MQVVADHLAEYCKQVTKTLDRDHFARSAFNRYYYATFLTIRETLASIDPRWDEPSHKDVPKMLRTSVVRRFQQRSRSHAMSPEESATYSRRGRAAAKALAELIKTGYETRKLADYEPTKLVVFEKSTISLGGVKTSTARRWCIDAKTRCQVLIDVAKKFGLC